MFSCTYPAGLRTFSAVCALAMMFYAHVLTYVLQLGSAVRAGRDKDSIWLAVRVGSLTTFLREFQALHCLQYSRYAAAIFRPKSLIAGGGDYG